MIDLLRIMSGLLIWLAAFGAVYGLHGLGCSLGWPGIDAGGVTLFRAVLVAAWGGAILAQITVLAAIRSPSAGSDSPFVRKVSVITALVGVVATLWSLFPVAVISSCG